jgi:outer membrane lipoprotein-sorting protein
LKRLFLTRQNGSAWPLAVFAVAFSGCAVRRTATVSPSAVPPRAEDASLPDLVASVNAQSKAIQTMTATVNLEPTAGSVYSGVIKEYHDVRSFILVQRPAMIRMVGQAPVVRTDIFDMVSDGEEFRLFVPSKHKFIVGKTEVQRPAKNALENLRPQHILEALLIPPIDADSDLTFRYEAEEGARRYYVVGVLDKGSKGDLNLKRQIWFDREDLRIGRVEFFGPQGVYLEGVQYAAYQDFQGVRYPTQIKLTRPVEDYALSINLQKVTFNQPIPPEKFELKPPQGVERVELSSLRGGASSELRVANREDGAVPGSGLNEERVPNRESQIGKTERFSIRNSALTIRSAGEPAWSIE